MFEKSLRVVSESNHYEGQRPITPPSSRSHLKLPRTVQQDNIIAAIPRKVYANAHAYHIHSISVNSDQETYISADDLRVNLWNLGISDQSFSTSLIQQSQSHDHSHCHIRHRRHQTYQYGRTYRGHHRRRVPSTTLQLVYVLEFEEQHQACRHA